MMKEKTSRETRIPLKIQIMTKIRKIIILAVTGMALALSACNNSGGHTQNFNLDTAKLKSGEIYYQCEMNPEVISDSAGHCPKCDMELIEKVKR